MKIRHRSSGDEGTASRFNTHGLGEVLGSIRDHYDTWPIRDLEVWLERKGQWKDMRQAFKDHDLITDNYNTTFFEPQNEVDRVRGYAL